MKRSMHDDFHIDEAGGGDAAWMRSVALKENAVFLQLPLEGGSGDAEDVADLALVHLRVLYDLSDMPFLNLIEGQDPA